MSCMQWGCCLVLPMQHMFGVMELCGLQALLEHVPCVACMCTASDDNGVCPCCTLQHALAACRAGGLVLWRLRANEASACAGEGGWAVGCAGPWLLDGYKMRPTVCRSPM
jgi:hypothetical protein